MNIMDNKGLRLRVSASDDQMREYHFSIEFFIFQENGTFIAYSPALDLSSSAETYNEAISNFYEMFQLYVESCVESGTLQEDLQAHGWKLHKKSKSLQPPSFSVLMKKPEMKKLLESHINFERIVTPARMPLLV